MKQAKRRKLDRIRPATLADLPALLSIEDEAFSGDRLDRRAFRHAIGSGTIIALAAEDAAGLVSGYVLVQLRRGSDWGWLTSVAIRPSCKGRGLGAELVAAAEAATREAGRNRLRLEVRADNAAAIGLYERAGYGRTGTVPDYYEDGEAAVRFAKNLG